MGTPESAEVEPQLSRGERRRARTRGELVDATRVLIAEKGVDGLRIDQITALADVALGSFYNHFDSKEAAVEAVVEQTIEALVERIAERSQAELDAEEAAIVPLRRFIRLAYEDLQLAGLLVNLDRADAIFERAVLPFATTALERGIAEERFQIDHVPITLTGVLGGALALMRGILDERLGPNADVVYAVDVLRSFGLPDERAREIAARQLPEF